MRKSTFKKHIDTLQEEDLRTELLELYDRFQEVRTYYKMDLGSVKDREKVYDTAKKEIAKKYLTKSYRRPRRPRIKAVNKIIRTLEKNAIFQHDLIDVYLFTAETAAHFMNEYDYYSEVLVNNIVNNYTKACNGINEAVVHKEYKPRAQKVIEKLNYSFGLKMTLRRVFLEVYPEEKKVT